MIKNIASRSRLILVIGLFSLFFAGIASYGIRDSLQEGSAFLSAILGSLNTSSCELDCLSPDNAVFAKSP